MDKDDKKIDEISHLVYKMFSQVPASGWDESSADKKKVIFESTLTDITIEEGSSNVRLACKISNCNINSNIIWYKNEEELLVEQLKDKYHFTKSYNRLNLEILNVNIDDAGQYECKVKNQYSEISSKCKVNVYENIEKRRSKMIAKDIEERNGKEDFFKMVDDMGLSETNGSNGDLSDHKERSKEIRDAREKSMHKDMLPTLMHRQHMFESHHATDRPMFGTQLSDRTCTEHSSSVKFTCSLISSACEISWEKNDIPLRALNRYRTTLEDGLAILEIFDVNNEDSGKYSCIASNKLGESKTSAKLNVYSGFKPSVTLPPTFTRHMKGITRIIYLNIAYIVFYCCVIM